MQGLFSSAWFQVVAVPPILMLVGVFARRLGRRDGDTSPRANDWAVATTVLLMLLGIIFGDLRDPKAQTTELLGWLIGVLFTGFASLDHDRYRSWERDANNAPTDRKRIWVGVVIPDMLCLVVFGVYQGQKVGII